LAETALSTVLKNIYIKDGACTFFVNAPENIDKLFLGLCSDISLDSDKVFIVNPYI